MKIQQVQEFTLFDRRKEQLVIAHFRRVDDYFLMEKTTQAGEVIGSHSCSETFAQTVLEYALICLPKSDLQIVRRSTGTTFNYPTSHI